MPYLQPYKIFNEEHTRVNQLYWMSKYSYQRMESLLGMLSSTGHVEPDPRVDRLWPSTDAGESNHITVKLSDFSGFLANSAGRLRTVSILFQCSAFETALEQYYTLCGIYRPGAISSPAPYDSVPELLNDRAKYEAAKRWAGGKARDNLRGKYSGRVSTLYSTFGLPMPATLQTTDLDLHYSVRHQIAHNQGLSSIEGPDVPAIAILQSRVDLSEDSWKAMMGAFHCAIHAIDRSIKKSLVVDLGLPLAVYHITERDGPVTLGALQFKVAGEFGLQPTHREVLDAAIAIGRTTKKNGESISKVLVA